MRKGKLVLLLVVLCLSSMTVFAQNGFVADWLNMVSKTQAEQPHWVTPVATVTPRLEQEFRFDAERNTLATGPGGGGNPLWIVDNGKGVEIIPQSHIELLFNLPPYLDHDIPKPHNGLGDVSFLGKVRLFSANEEHGNYIVTFFLGGTIPTGVYGNGASAAVVTPTLAAGKGWGRFDVESTLGAGLPVTGHNTIGHAIAWNVTNQYHVARYIWAEFEINSTFYDGGEHDGKKQVFLTPGLVIGRFKIHNRVGLTIGAGEQIAATHYHQYKDGLILTVRVPF
jgi:hypothetical protein